MANIKYVQVHYKSKISKPKSFIRILKTKWKIIDIEKKPIFLSWIWKTNSWINVRCFNWQTKISSIANEWSNGRLSSSKSVTHFQFNISNYKLGTGVNKFGRFTYPLLASSFFFTFLYIRPKYCVKWMNKKSSPVSNKSRKIQLQTVVKYKLLI